MEMLMADSRLNGAERALQHIFSKPSKFGHIFNGLSVGLATLASFALIDRLPDHRPLPLTEGPLAIRAVRVDSLNGDLRLAGAWELRSDDPRFGGISALAFDRGRFLAVTDRGAVIRFDPPGVTRARIRLADLREGPGPFARKWARDAESLAPDPRGRGWWVGYEQRHSLWLYDNGFSAALASVDLDRTQWRDNRGAEGLIVDRGELLVLGENGRDAIRVGPGRLAMLEIQADADIAEAATAPDGSHWALLREKGLEGITQAIAPLQKTPAGYRIGPRRPVPKAALDNYEGMTIEPRPDGGWRFWLITDDGHRIMARTLLVALDLKLPARHDKSPARSTGLSNKPVAAP